MAVASSVVLCNVVPAVFGMVCCYLYTVWYMSAVLLLMLKSTDVVVLLWYTDACICRGRYMVHGRYIPR